MFLDFFFTINVLLLLSFATQVKIALYPFWGSKFVLGLVYCVFIALAFYEKRRGKNSREIAAKFLLLVFLGLYHFAFAYHLYYSKMKSLIIFGSLAFYFSSLFIFYRIKEESYKRAKGKILLILPFVLPFLFFSLLQEIFEGKIIFEWISPFMFLGLVIFFPALLQKFWSHESIDDPGLERICKKANFSHAGLKIWSVMDSTLTAAIVGVVSKFRYILFSRRLLAILNEGERQAVLAHEIAHSKKKHFFFYLAILLILLFLNQIFWLFLSPSFEHIFHLLALMNYLKIDASLFFILLIQALLFFTYLKLIFGSLSKQFEKEADFFIFELKIAPENLIQALEKVALFGGIDPKKSGWQHFSIARRKQDLQKAMNSPDNIKMHKRRMKRIKTGIFLILLLLSIFSLAGFNAKSLGLESLDNKIVWTSESLKETLSLPLRVKFARNYLKTYPQEGEQSLITKVLQSSLSYYAADTVPGLWQYYAAQKLFEKQQYKACIFFMQEAWKNFAFDQQPKAIKDAFWSSNLRIIESLKERKDLQENLHELMQVSQKYRP